MLRTFRVLHVLTLSVIMITWSEKDLYIYFRGSPRAKYMQPIKFTNTKKIASFIFEYLGDAYFN